MNNQSKKLLFDVLTACQEIMSFLAGHGYLWNLDVQCPKTSTSRPEASTAIRRSAKCHLPTKRRLRRQSRG